MADQVLERDTTENEMLAGVNDDYATKYGFSDVEDYVFKAEKGLDENVIRDMSTRKGEPQWMLDIRLKAYQHFLERPMPDWGADLSGIDFSNIYYYIKPSARQEDNWEDVPSYIKDTFDKLGIPQAEQKFLSGVAAQYESEVVYHSIKRELEDKGVIFLGMDDGLAQYPDLVREYFTTIIPHNDNKFAALNTAVWSGGSFIYVPPGVHVEMPLQAYFRINAKNVGQFERTLIIVDEGAYVHYVEGCTAPIYSSDSLHSAVVEIIVKKGGRCRYTTIQNWSNNVYNLVTKRAVAHANATMEWVDGNLGSKVTMKYPAVYLMGEGAHGEILSIAFAGHGQHQDAGGKVVHMAPRTSSRIISKSISKGGGRASYRGLLKVAEGAYDCKSNVVCDALLLDEHSRSDTYPYIEINEQDVTIGHEASVSKVGEEQVFYLMSRGIPEDAANAMIVNGFIEPLVKELPMEYAIEMNRLIQLQMEGSIGWLPSFTRDAVEQLSASLDEPQWMRDFRLAAWEIYAALPVPTTQHEAWRRTDIRRLKLDALGPSLNGSHADGPAIPSYMGAQLTEEAAGGVLVEANGIVTQYEVSAALQAQGVIFCDMHTAVRDHGDLVRKHFMTHAVRPDEGKFAALHAAFWRGGVFLYVPRNVVAAAPLHSALWATSGRTFTHTLVVLDTNSEATFMDEYASPAGEGQAFHNGAIELIVGDGASLRYASLQDFGPNVWQFNHECGRVGRDGKLDWITSVMGTRLTKAFQTSELDAPGAWARMSGIFFTNGRQHVDLDTQQNHNAPDTTSDLLYKGALKDHSRTVWQGMIKALPDSQRIDGFQANRNLMLDKTARADSIPGLEIQADDVRCTHASTVGKLDEEEVFYLMSRGIPRAEAIRMVIQGFFDPVMQRIPFEGVRTRIFDRILEKVG